MYRPKTLAYTARVSILKLRMAQQTVSGPIRSFFVLARKSGGRAKVHYRYAAGLIPMFHIIQKEKRLLRTATLLEEFIHLQRRKIIFADFTLSRPKPG